MNNKDKQKKRIIKFRIWDKRFKCFYYPSVCFPLQINNRGEMYYETGVSKRDNYILQQYTEFKDEKEKEIYEGDILKLENLEYEANDEVGDVRFFEGAYYWWNSYGEQLRDYIKDEKDNKVNLKIVGNIFQNADLLK